LTRDRTEENEMTQSKQVGGAIAATLILTVMGCTQPAPSTSTETPPSDASAESVEAPAIERELPADDVILQTVLNQVESADLCDGFYDPEVMYADSQVYAVDDTALVEIVCSRAAYQLIYAYAIYQRDGTVYPVMLDVVLSR
jgi:hypothetical protein